MAEEIKTPMSDFDKVTEVKDTAEIILLQDGVNARVEAPVFEQKLLDKTNDRYLGKTETAESAKGKGEVSEDNNLAVSGMAVHKSLIPNYYNELGYISSDMGYAVEDQNTYNHTQYLRISDKDNLLVSGYSNPNGKSVLVAFYDLNLDYIGGYFAPNVNDGDVELHKVPSDSIPSKSIYIRCTRRKISNKIDIKGVYLDSTIINLPYNYNKYSWIYLDRVFTRKTDGDLETSPLYSTSKFLPINGTLKVTGYSGVNNIAFVSFYDKNYKYLGFYNVPEANGDVVDAEVPAENIPAGAKFVRVSKRLGAFGKVMGVDFKYLTEPSDVSDLAKKELIGKAVDQTAEGYISKHNGELNAGSDYKYTDMYIITSRSALIIGAGYSGVTNNVALVAFYDKYFKFVGYYNAPTNGVVTKHQVPEEDIPADAKYLKCSLYNVYTFTVEGAEKLIITGSKELDQILLNFKNELPNPLALTVNNAFTNEGYINKHTGKPLDTNNSTYRFSEYLELVDKNNFVVNGWSGVSNNAGLVYFYDDKFNPISYYNAPTNGVVTKHQVPEEDIPADAKYVRINSTQTQTKLVTGVSLDFSMPTILQYINAKSNESSQTPILPERSGKPNPDKGGYLKFLNYLGNNQNIHPKVLFFDTEWNGYKYWMAYTPYPEGNVEHENPCIAASNDGMNWETPVGLVNPLELRPVTEDHPKAYNSDAHLVYNNDTNKLECWWRSLDPEISQPCVKRRVSSDGINWDATEIIFDYGVGGPQVSQSIIYDNGIYKYWACNAGNVIYTESEDVFNFPEFTTLPIDFAGSNLTAWHMDVIKTPKGYEFAVQCWETGFGNNNTSDLYYILFDGSSYSKPRLIVERGDLPTDDDYMGIYRASILYHNYNTNIPRQGGYYFIYYSALGRNYANRNIFLTAGRSVERLRGINL